MTEAIVAGAVAGAIAGAIVAAAIGILMRQRGPQWQSFTFKRDRSSAETPRMRAPGEAAPAAATARLADRAWNRPLLYSAFTFELLDESGKRVLAIAQDEAIRMNHNYIGTEHLLLGLIRGDAEGPAGRALARLGISLDKARTALEFIIGRGDAPVGPSEITVSPRTRKVLELAMAEAAELGHLKMGATEILLGLVREGEGIASGIIESLGVTLAAMHQAVLEELAGAPPRPAPASPVIPPARPRTYHGPFDRFNDRAKRVLALAQDESVRFNHNYIGPEHLLLGLVREGEGVAARALAALGISLGKTREAVERVVGRGESTTATTEITLTPRTKKVIELAIDEARELGHDGIGTEHLLLGILRDDTSIACRILLDHGAPPEKVRAYVIATLGGQPPLFEDPPSTAGA